MAVRLILVVGGGSALVELVREVVEPDVNAIVRTVPSAEQALAFVQNLRPALILLDEVVSASSGPTLVRRLRSTCALSDVPIIVLGMDSAFEETLASSASVYLRKPVGESELRRAIRRGVHLLERW